jgi:hypothetical protein
MLRRPVVACLAALVLASCGGDDALSPQAYRAEAGRICADGDRATTAVRQPARATAAAIADYFQRLLRANERTTRRFGALEPPESLRAAHAAALEANAGAVREVRRLIAQLEQGVDPRRALAAARPRLERLSARADAAARRLGVAACADR